MTRDFCTLFITGFISLGSYSQNSYNKVIWDKSCDCPVIYATIHNEDQSTISNEDGRFNLKTSISDVEINLLGYQPRNINLTNVSNDTIFMEPKLFELDEIVVDQNGFFKNMLGTILNDYALKPHVERFYLRAVLKRNSTIIKIVDLSGKIKKETLFNTKSFPMPKNNYTIEVENMRKAERKFRDYDFKVINFEDFLKWHNSFYVSTKDFVLSYKAMKDNSYPKIIAKQRNFSEKGRIEAYFIVNDKNNFEEANFAILNTDEYDVINRDLKNRTKKWEVTSSFAKNTDTDKFQINKSNFKILVDVLYKDSKDEFDMNIIYYAEPLAENTSVKNNVNFEKEIVDLKFKYDEDYWNNHPILPLNTEMQEFIDNINTSSNSSEFRTSSNMK